MRRRPARRWSRRWRRRERSSFPPRWSAVTARSAGVHRHRGGGARGDAGGGGKAGAAHHRAGPASGVAGRAGAGQALSAQARTARLLRPALSAPRVEVVLSDDALERLPAHVEGPVVVVMDANTRLAAGVRVLAALEAARVDAEPVVFERRSGLAATPEAVQRVHERLTGGRL